MFFTREADYGIRMIRALSKGEKMNIAAICAAEEIPRQFAYKILKKLSTAEIVTIIRGVNGGYVLKRPLEELTLYDIVSVIDTELFLNKCLNTSYQCERNKEELSCKVHNELQRVQSVLVCELQKTPVKELF